VDALDPSLLVAARSGDARAFDQLVAPHRRVLSAHCYRMLGSLADADDAVQETLIRAWKGLGSWEERASLRTWLHRIATNVCIDAAAKRKRRTMPTEVGAPLAAGERPRPSGDDEVPWLEPAPPELWQDESPEAAISARESVRIAFMCALQRLPASQRAVLLLRDVLGWSADEVAESLETTAASVESALQRARATMGSPATKRPRDEASLRALLERYLRAWESGAPEAFATVLREDAVLTMPPMAAWLKGRDAIADLVQWLHATMGQMKCVVTTAAGGPAIAMYTRKPGGEGWEATAVHVLVVDDDRVAEAHAFLLPGLFHRLGLPAKLEG
jgi:RNA polymerase sigma-70 factor (ECF subfamily)